MKNTACPMIVAAACLMAAPPLAQMALAQEADLERLTAPMFRHHSLVGVYPLAGGPSLISGGVRAGEIRSAVLATPVMGGPTRVLFAGTDGAYPEFIRDGVLYVADRINNAVVQLGVLDPDGNFTPLTSSPGLKTAVGPALGGDFFVFLRTDDVGGQFVDRIYRTTGGEPALLLQTDQDVGTPILSPDGRLLYYTATMDDDGSQIYEMDLASGTTRQLTDGPGFKLLARAPEGMPPDLGIAFMTATEDLSIFELSLLDPATLQVRDIIEPTDAPIFDVVYDADANTLYLKTGSQRICVPIGPGPFLPTDIYEVLDLFDYSFAAARVDGVFGHVIGVQPDAGDFAIYRVQRADDCPADLDGDGELTIFDFLAFQNLFALGDPAADFDGDGELTIFDFLAFQNAFDMGCP